MPKNKEIEKQKNKEIMDARIEELKKIYVVRSFKTTTESIKFTRKIAKAMSGLGSSIDDSSEADISEFLNFFEPEIIKYVVGGFVLKRNDKKNAPIEYEKEFIGDFETLSIVFAMTIQHLMEKANSTGKPKAQNQQIVSTKR